MIVSKLRNVVKVKLLVLIQKIDVDVSLINIHFVLKLRNTLQWFVLESRGSLFIRSHNERSRPNYCS